MKKKSFIVLLQLVCGNSEIQSNEMRFNKQELATLATQPSNKFEKEGILYVTERQDGFFRRSEGNFLFEFFFPSSFDKHHFIMKSATKLVCKCN